jgi:DNA polymerase III delta prime subunit
MNMFVKATKKKAKLRLGLLGPTGSGKTYTALAIAQGLGKRIAVIDSEHGSASLYSDIFDFDSCELKSFSPRDYIEAIASAHDYDVLIIDSISHEWAGKDGCLDKVAQIGADNSKGDKNYFAWGQVTPKHNEFIEALLSYPGHLIATIRAKMDYALVVNDKGKPAPVKVGLGPVQRDGVEYEFSILGLLDQEHNLTITKSRFPELDGQVYTKPGKALGEYIASWLSTGAEIAVPEPATKDDFSMLTVKAADKGWTAHMLGDYCEALYGKDFRKKFTKQMILDVSAAIDKAEKITDRIAEATLT